MKGNETVLGMPAWGALGTARSWPEMSHREQPSEGTRASEGGVSNERGQWRPRGGAPNFFFPRIFFIVVKYT